MLDSVSSRLGTTSTDLVVVLVSALVIYVSVIAATRIVGLRSFSKMSAFDFAMTVAIGSIIATVATGSVALLDGLIAVVILYAAQFSVSWLRRRSDVLGIVDNRPLLLMHDGIVLQAHLDRARISDADLRGKLREANVGAVSEVQAVVLETTGDISVLTGDHLDASLLRGVVGAERIAG